MGKVKKVTKKVKKKVKKKDAGAGNGKDAKGQEAEKKPAEKEKKPFSTVEVFSKPGAMSPLFEGFRSQEISGEILRPRLMTESVEHGRGRGIIRNFSFRKFKEEPRAVLFMVMPRGVGGGSFEPTDRLLKPGEQIQITYTMEMEGADRPIYFMAKGFFLRKSFYSAENPQNADKPWVGSRDEANEKLPKNLVVAGDDIIELRIDNVTCFPSGPGSMRRDVLDRYLSQAKLYILPGGAVWNQKSTQGNFFDCIRDPLDKFLEKEGVKVIERVTLDEFGNLGEISVHINEQLLSNVEHDIIRPSVIKKPNDFLREINSNLGFLLHFKMGEEIKEAVMRTFPQKAGKEEDVFLPLFLQRVREAKERYRLIFRIFPRDLVEERSRKSMNRGLKFMPPYALHQGAENHNTYSKMLIAISKRFREDEKPEDEKVKSEKLQASVQKRIAEQQHKFVDEKVKGAFKGRQEAKKRKEEGG